jgi:hypothetical protein
MRFLLDESADFRLSPHLLKQGHDVWTVARDYTRSLPDVDVLAIARLAFVLREHADRLNHFLVVTDRRVRSRGPSPHS